MSTASIDSTNATNSINLTQFNPLNHINKFNPLIPLSYKNYFQPLKTFIPTNPILLPKRMVPPTRVGEYLKFRGNLIFQ